MYLYLRCTYCSVLTDRLLYRVPLVQLDLEDPTLLEIAEILDSQGGDKYTVMLVRNAEDVDNASFVQVQMLNEDGRESVRYVNRFK